MRLINYRSEQSWRAGIVVGATVIDAARAADGLAADGDWTSTKTILGAPIEARTELAESANHLVRGARGVMRLAELTVGPPVLDPGKILCIGLNYRDHAAEAELPVPEVPPLFAKFGNSLAGPGDPIQLPASSAEVDYEGELAIVVGKRVKAVDPASASEAIGGVMAFNDLSARDLQFKTGQWTLGKAIDGFAPCGPAVVTLDEVGDLQNLSLQTRVNGITLQDGNTKNMIFTAVDVVAFLSQTMTLDLGDIIALGTPAGVGMSRQPPVFLQDGDVVEVELEGVGALSNRLVAPSPA